MSDSRRGARPDAITVQVGLPLRMRLRDFAERDHRDQAYHVREAIREYLDRLAPEPTVAESGPR